MKTSTKGKLSGYLKKQKPSKWERERYVDDVVEADKAVRALRKSLLLIPYYFGLDRGRSLIREMLSDLEGAPTKVAEVDAAATSVGCRG